MAEDIKTKRDEVSGTSKRGIMGRNQEGDGVSSQGKNIAFTTDFWTIPIGESFMMIIMHWITRDWRLKMHILGTISFPKDHTVANISEKPTYLRLEFGLYPKSPAGRIAQCSDAVRLAKLMYFRLKPQQDKPRRPAIVGATF